MTVKDAIKQELERLPEDVLEKVLDFIRLLESKKEMKSLTDAAQKLSENSFDTIWNNEEDAVYDDLWEGKCSSCSIPIQ